MIMGSLNVGAVKLSLHSDSRLVPLPSVPEVVKANPTRTSPSRSWQCSRKGPSRCVSAHLCLKEKESGSASKVRASVWIQAATLPMSSEKEEPLKIIICGAPASGKGTQCELIVQKYGLVHISAGDLLRAEVDSGTENGRRAKEYMERGSLVPDEIIVTGIVDSERTLGAGGCPKNGWLLDGYPRSHSQAAALEGLGIRPDVFILLDVPDEVLVERVVGRRLDPVTGKIYHLKYSPPESEEIANRLIQRFDDTEEKVKLRLKTHEKNVSAVISTYKDVFVKVNGNRPKEQVFEDIDVAISAVQTGKGEIRDTAAKTS